MSGAAEVCSRNALVMQDDQREELWFGFLRDVVRWAEKTGSAESARNRRQVVLAATIQEVLSAVLGDGVATFLPLQVVLRRIAEDFSHYPVALLRTQLGSLLHDLQTQQNLVSSSSSLSSVDVQRSFHKLYKMKGLALVAEPGATVAKSIHSIDKAARDAQLISQMPVGSPSALGRMPAPRGLIS